MFSAYTTDYLENNSSSANSLRNINGNAKSLYLSPSEFASHNDPGIIIAKPVENAQEWLPESNPPPFPDCSVVSHSSMVVTMPSSMTFELTTPDGNEDELLSYEDDYYDFDEENTFPDSACDDSFFLGKVTIRNHPVA